MRIIKILILAMVAVLSQSTALLAQDAKTGTVRGTLIEKELGEPVMFANVFLKDNPSVGVETDLDGKYEKACTREGSTSFICKRWVGQCKRYGCSIK